MAQYGTLPLKISSVNAKHHEHMRSRDIKQHPKPYRENIGIYDLTGSGLSQKLSLQAPYTK